MHHGYQRDKGKHQQCERRSDYHDGGLLPEISKGRSRVVRADEMTIVAAWMVLFAHRTLCPKLAPVALTLTLCLSP